MLNKILFPKGTSPRRRDNLRNLDREKHFEALYMQSFTDMRARSPKA